MQLGQGWGAESRGGKRRVRQGQAQHLESLSSGQVRGAVKVQCGFSRKAGVVTSSPFLAGVPPPLPPGRGPSISICQGSANLRLRPGSEDSRPGLEGLPERAPRGGGPRLRHLWLLAPGSRRLLRNVDEMNLSAGRGGRGRARADQ